MTERSSLRDRDLVQWLENKLSASDELWSGRNASLLLSKEVLEELPNCFQDLQSHVKLRLLLAIVHLPCRNVELWKHPLNELLSLGLKDTDDWVQMIAELFKEYPRTMAISYTLDDDSSHFSRTLIELRRLVREQAKDGDLRLLPSEMSYCSASAVRAQFPLGSHIQQHQQQQQRKHFALRRRPKSATLRADLLAKAADMINQPKNKLPNYSLSSTVPMRLKNPSKKPDNTCRTLIFLRHLSRVIRNSQ